MSFDILTKRMNYERWQRGCFGNKLKSWRTVEEWRESGFTDKVALRQLGSGGGRCVYHLDRTNMDEAVACWRRFRVPDELMMVNEQAPDGLLIQGEYRNSVVEIDNQAHCAIFYYSTVRKQMREALTEASETTCDLRANLLLRHYMSPASYDDWQMLLGQYPNHVLEVSVYDTFLGDCPRRNALVWEIRKY